MDTNKIKQIITLFEESKLASMDLEIDDIKIKMTKATTMEVVSAPQQATVPVNAPVVEKTIEKDYLKSPVVGTFYASNAVGAKPLAVVGKKVKQGDVVCIIEAMKVMNEIKAHRSGIIEEILINDGSMVQFNEAILVIGNE